MGWFILAFCFPIVLWWWFRKDSEHDRLLRLTLQVVAGIGILAFGLASATAYSHEARTYGSDPSCARGTQLSVHAQGGACTVVDATVSALYQYDWLFHRRSSRYLIFTTPDGTRRRAKLSISEGRNYAVWSAANAHPGMPARVQLIDGRAPLIETSAGLAVTNDLPEQRFIDRGELAAAGAGLIFFGLLELLASSTRRRQAAW
jgi:hypothetical protein